MINEMDVFVLSANDGEDGEADDWHGFVQAIRSSMQTQSEALGDKVQGMVTKVESRIQQDVKRVELEMKA
jgi:hypothetical protein